MAEVVKFQPVEVGVGFRFDADEKLEEAKGYDLTTLLILGENADGELYCVGTANAGESLMLLERAKRFIVFGE
jgi:hypothetical protein